MCHTPMEPSPVVSPPQVVATLLEVTLASGILSLILGVLVLAWPGISILVAAMAFHCLPPDYRCQLGLRSRSLACMFRRAAGSCAPPSAVPSSSWLSGFRHFGDAVLLLAIWIGIRFIFHDVATRAVSAISDPMLPGRGWSIFVA